MNYLKIPNLITKYITLIILLQITPLSAQQTTTTLDYGTFSGIYDEKYNITIYRRIPFAAPPLGENRFRGPQPPENVTGEVYDSNRGFDPCPASRPQITGQEDCLYLTLYSRPFTLTHPPHPLRPIVISFFGGGFIRGGGSQSLPPSGYPILNTSPKNDFLMIYPNYRTNAFGFLPGSRIAADANSDLNPGLLDQEAVLRWVKRYAGVFGGDAEDVSIFGQSAGGGSVVAQVLSTARTMGGGMDEGGGSEGAGYGYGYGYRGKKEKLFNRALASSPFWPKTYRFDAPEAEELYEKLARMTGCSGDESLKCLKTVDFGVLSDAAAAIAADAKYGANYFAWAPVIDGVFLKMSLSEAVRSGGMQLESGWGMYNTFEGESFIPPLNTTTSLTSWLQTYLPHLTPPNRARLLTLYPPNGTTETLPAYSTITTQAGLIFRDSTLTCPSYWLALAAQNTSYVGEYTIPPAKHASDVIYWNSVNEVQIGDPLVYRGFTGAFAGFFQEGDPNWEKLTDDTQVGVPEAKSTGAEFVVRGDGFGNVGMGQLKERCGFWLDVADEVGI